MKTAGARLRQALRKECVVMPGAYNAAVARQIERAGFPAVYISGAGLANATAGVPDIGLLSLEEVAQLAGYIARAVSIPALADADTGFGGTGAVARTVRAFERLGLAGLHLEDQVFPKRCGHLAGKKLVSVRAMTAKIRAAVRARQDPDFLIVARTDARAVEGFPAAVERARTYLAAGADAIFPEALESVREFQDFAARLPGAVLLANMTEFGKSPLLNARQLARLGYSLVIFPLTAFRVSMRASEICLRALQRRGTQRSWLKKMQTRRQLYDLLDYDPSAPAWPAPA
jgi:methylisocitrate lyase